MCGHVHLDLTVVIPVYNEEDNLEPLLVELEDVLKTAGKSFEVILVDDCSKDNSVAVAQKLQATRPWLRLVRHRVNSGESASGATGFRFARGEFIATMDADMQNDAHDLPAFFAAMKPGIAAVCGDRRAKRKEGDDWVRRISSKLANGFRNALTGEWVADAGCTYRLLRRSCIHDLPVFNGLHRFIPTILRYQGFQVAEVAVNNRPRTRGVSKYGIGNRMWRGIRDCFAMRWYRARAVRADRVMTDDGHGGHA